VPVGLAVAGANRHDCMLLGRPLGSVPVARPRPTRERPQGVCLAKGYVVDRVYALLTTLGFTAHVRGRREEAWTLRRTSGARARRWVVERTHSWINRFRALLVRWDKKTANYLGSLHLACAYLTFARAGLLGWALSSTSPLFWTYSACRPGLSCAGGGGRACREQGDGKAAGS
jgi:putative transposase